jgi:hypothetical protein
MMGLALATLIFHSVHRQSNRSLSLGFVLEHVRMCRREPWQRLQNFGHVQTHRRLSPLLVTRGDRVEDSLVLIDQHRHRGGIRQAEKADSHLRLAVLDNAPGVLTVGTKGEESVEIREPGEARLVVSSIQVLAEWPWLGVLGNRPREHQRQARCYRWLLFRSGERHRVEVQRHLLMLELAGVEKRLANGGQ